MVEKQRITREYYNNAQAELKILIEVERPDNQEKLRAAREQGDLSENAEYSEERDRQARIDARIKELESIINNAIIIDDEVLSNNLGKYITIIYEDDNSSFEFQLIGASIESDPLMGKVSIESPLGRAVLEANIGSHVLVKPEQGKEFTVIVTNIRKA